MKLVFSFAVMSLVAGCATVVPVVDLSKVPATELAESMKVRIFTIDGGTAYPPIASVLGDVSAYSCKHLSNDPPASKGDALKRLRLEAFKLKADAVIDVTFDVRGTDPWGTNCWESVQASGQAVKLKP